jgi:hypothetical protein
MQVGLVHRRAARRGSLTAAIATRQHPPTTRDLGCVSRENWSALRHRLEQRRHVGTLRTQFRPNPQAYLANLEQLACQLTLPTQKKTAHASEQEPPDVAAQRQAGFEAQPDRGPEHLVFIDKTVASTKMPPCVPKRSAASAVDHPSRKSVGKPPPSPDRCGSKA